MGIILLNPLSKATQSHEITLNGIPSRLIVFDGETEWNSAIDKGDILSGNLTTILNEMGDSFIKQILVLAKRANPKITHFIIKKV